MVAVIVNHLLSWPTGGFVGVDIFFVISGYLITGLLLREHEKTGRISWANFYRRRIRRLMPASTLILAVTVFAAYFLYRSARFDTIRADAVWSLFFASNWHFAAVGTDYWQASGPVSPLRHFWSLAVEEQFYIVWPVVMIAVLGGVGRILRRRGRSPLPVLVAAITALTVASFVWGLHDTASNPTAAYFSTFSRAWELGVGALLAVVAPLLRKLRGAVRTILSWLGLIGIVASLALITSNSPFPAPAGALPVVSSAFVLAAGIGGVPRFSFLLTNRISGYIGKISYSLYLWHFPVIVLLPEVVTLSTGAGNTVALVLIAGLSAASFQFVEDPVRRSSWLNPTDQRRTDRKRRAYLPTLGYTGLAALAVVVTIGVSYSFTNSRVSSAAVALAANAQTGTHSVAASVHVTLNAANGAGTPQQGELSAQIDLALKATEWPTDLSPSIDDVIANGLAVKCGAPEPSACDQNTKAPKKVIVIGDSIGGRLTILAREALKGAYNVETDAMASCFAVLLTETYPSAAKKAECEVHKAEQVANIKAQQPDIVFITDTYGVSERVPSTADASTAAKWQKGLTDLLMAIKGSVKRIIVVSPPPVGQGLSDCAAKQSSSPRDCITTVPDLWRQLSTAEQAAVVAAGPTVTFWDTSRWYCSAGGQCPIFAGTTITRFDGVHSTGQYLHRLVPVFNDRLHATLGST